MTRVRVEGFTISLDGYGAGPNQDIRNPLGVGGTDLHQWLVPTRTFQRTLFGADGGTTGIDDDFAARGFKNVGAWILGRNMFGPIRGSWPRHELERLVGGQPTVSRSNFHLDSSRAPAHPDGRRHDVPLHNRRHSRGARPCTRGRCRNGRPDRRWAGHNPASIFVRASLMNCTLLSRRSCSAGGNRCSKGLTCGLWDTNALNS